MFFLEKMTDAIPRLQCLFLDIMLQLLIRQLIWFALSELVYYESRDNSSKICLVVCMWNQFLVCLPTTVENLSCLAVSLNNQ